MKERFTVSYIQFPTFRDHCLVLFKDILLLSIFYEIPYILLYKNSIKKTRYLDKIWYLDKKKQHRIFYTNFFLIIDY